MKALTHLRQMPLITIDRNYVLAIAVIFALTASAIAVANSVHKSRVQMKALQKEQIERDRLETEWGQLLLEQHAWGAYGRVGKVATEQLQMRPPLASEIIMVRR